ncbi:MAG: NUDIX domain-containing protein [Lachnospiraceae bacterium]|nr:NUDIX domain-containing protein [Lachnospiraceae bacterium]
MDQLLVLVDESDQETGYGEKLHVHQNALLHRAFSIFVFDWDKEEMLLQRRASGKYHSGGLWSNACCSHPRKGETMAHALNNRLKAELGLETDVKIQSPPDGGCFMPEKETIYRCGAFHYFASFGGLSENELDHVFLYGIWRETGSDKAFFHPELPFNPEEIEELKWISICELKKWLSESPVDFTAWFRPAFELAYSVLSRQTIPDRR